MGWEKALLEKCAALNMEPAPAENPFEVLRGMIQGQREIVLICPKAPGRKEKAQIASVIPEGLTVKYVEGPKPSSVNTVASILGQSGYQVQRPNPLDVTKRTWHIKAGGGYPGCDEQGIDMDRLNKALTNDGYLELWDVEINGKIVEACYPKIALEISRNNTIRDTVIRQDDLTDLKITLETCKNIDEFLEAL